MALSGLWSFLASALLASALGAGVVALAFTLSWWAVVPFCALARRKRPVSASPGDCPHFVILVPAHDEEETISRTLASLERLDYPPERFTIVVIADNCSDGTAAAARRAGATVLERSDPDRRGKGPALAWGIARLPQVFDALVILDADSVPDPSMLRAFAARRVRGAQVMQAAIEADGHDRTPFEYVLSLGYFVDNAFSCGRAAAGLRVLLRGNGMCFSRDALARVPWTADSIIEDTEYTFELLNEGIAVEYVDETAVRTVLPTTTGQLAVQRLRWAGNLSFAHRHGPGRFLGALVRGRLREADAVWSVAASSRPAGLLAALAATGLGAIAVTIVPGTAARVALAIGLSALIADIAYVATAVIAFGLDRRRVTFLIYLPVFGIRLAVLTLRGLARGSKGVWERTPRAP